ncbi:MAG: RES family NAD+ phosphorylase [Cyclobacteriaceae bacterium]|nr:RES family NAD+ phosphorylase [Cyclobacteriaceae bacterium]
MEVYRLCKEKYAEKPDGEGAKRYGGRWNSKGTPMVYTSSTRSLAVLEVLTGLPHRQLPEGYVITTILLPHSPATLPEANIPLNWRQYPPPPILAKTGDLWISKMETLALSVPSVLIPQEQNILINPLFSDIKKIQITHIEPYIFDERLFAW